MLQHLIDPTYYRGLVTSPGPFSDWVAYLIACFGLLILVVPFVYVGALICRFTPLFSSSLDAYSRGRIAWAYGCLFGMLLCVSDLVFIVAGKRLSSIAAAIPFYCLILLLMVGVILHKGYVRKELRKIQKYSK